MAAPPCSSATQAVDQKLSVLVTVCDLGGSEFLHEVSFDVGVETRVGEFALMISKHLTPATSGSCLAFTSSHFSSVLVERQPDPETGVTQRNEELLHNFCVGTLYDGMHLNLEVVTITSELYTARCEEVEAYENVVQQASKETVHHCTVRDFPSYNVAKMWWEDVQSDLKSVQEEASLSFEAVLQSAEYVCPFASACGHGNDHKNVCCDHLFKSRDELLDHLQTSHRQHKVDIVGAAQRYLLCVRDGNPNPQDPNQHPKNRVPSEAAEMGEVSPMTGAPLFVPSTQQWQ